MSSKPWATVTRNSYNLDASGAGRQTSERVDEEACAAGADATYRVQREVRSAPSLNNLRTFMTPAPVRCARNASSVS